MNTLEPTLVRVAGLYGPVFVLGSLWFWRQPNRRTFGALVLAFCWNLPALLALHVLSQWAGWWSFGTTEATFWGFPVDLYLGWALLWGPVALLAFGRVHLLIVLLGVALLDTILMPLMHPVLTLSDGWFVGELVSIPLCLLPSQLLGRWTRDAKHVRSRATLQAVGFVGLIFGVLPIIILRMTGGTFQAVFERPLWLNGILFQVLLFPAILGLAAAYEFVERGRGTPLPFDPPERLVTTGPYAYLRSPMQVSASLSFLAWGVFLGSPWVALGSVFVFAFGGSLASFDEEGDLAKRFGPEWRAYRKHVRSWWPRWRPYSRPDVPEPLLYVAASCDVCSELRQWLEARRPEGLTIVPAENHPTRVLDRLTYDPKDGTTEVRGVVALAASMQHVNLGWAFAGWIIALPVVNKAIQLLVDVSGGAPRSPACAPIRSNHQSDANGTTD